MDRPKHTPGPWTLPKVTAADKEIVLNEVAVSIDYDDVDPKEAMANARLIAAAPRMYSFIEFCAAAGNAEAVKILEEINASHIQKAGG